MDKAIQEIGAQANVRLQALLRGRAVFSTKALVGLYKAQVLSYLEYATPALYHAPRFFLQRLDKIQDRFLEEVGLTCTEALLYYHLAPLPARRDISLLGLIHRTVLGQGPVHYRRFFHQGSTAALARGLREPTLRHTKQLFDPIQGSESNSLNRSALSLVYPYNLLPAQVVARNQVRFFQRDLQVAVSNARRLELPSWELVLSTGVKSLTVSKFQSLFSRHNSCSTKSA